MIVSVSISIIVILIYFSSRYFGNVFLGLEVDNTSAIFLALIPLAIYLITSGVITEFKGGGLELKFKEAAGENVLFESQEVCYEALSPQTKGGYSELKEMVKHAKEGKSTVLGLYSNKEYAPKLLQDYLRKLSLFEKAKYVVFRSRENEFKGFVTIKNLYDSMSTHQGNNVDDYYAGARYVVDLIKEDRAREIEGFRTDAIQNFVSNKDAIKILEEKGIPDIAVIDTKGTFLGFTDKNTILYNIVKNLLNKV